MKVLTERNPIWPCLVQKWASLQKTGFYALNSEWKKVPAGSHSSLAHAFLLLAAFWYHLVHFQGKKSILPYFSSLSMVAILDCDSHSQAGSTRGDPGPQGLSQTPGLNALKCVFSVFVFKYVNVSLLKWNESTKCRINSIVVNSLCTLQVKKMKGYIWP